MPHILPDGRRAKRKLKMPVYTWRCAQCHELHPGIMRRCPNSGSPRVAQEGENILPGNAKAFLTDESLICEYLALPEDIEVIKISETQFVLFRGPEEVSRNEVKRLYASAAESHCMYCGSDVAYDDETCSGCGSPRNTAKRSSVKRVSTPNLVRAVTESAPGRRIASSRVAKTTARAASRTRGAVENRVISAGVEPHKAGYYIAGLAVLVFLVLAFLFYHFVVKTEELSGRVAGQTWSTSVSLIEYVEKTGEGFEIPVGATLVSSEKRTTVCPEPDESSVSGTVTDTETLDNSSGVGLVIEEEVDTTGSSASPVSTCTPEELDYYFYSYLGEDSLGSSQERGSDLQPVWPQVRASNWRASDANPCQSALQRVVPEAEGVTFVNSCSISFTVQIFSGEREFVFRTSDETEWRRIISLGEVKFRGNRVGTAFID